MFITSHFTEPLQEALNNIVKHAQASQVWVDLSMEDDQVTLTIQDNGIGFGADQTRFQWHRAGRSCMKESPLQEAHSAISSTPKRGTILSAQFPLANDAERSESHHDTST